MKLSPSLPCLPLYLATAATVLIPLHRSSAEDSYREGPRIGSRIVLFLKDIAYGQNPNDRYRSVPPTSSSGMAPRQHTYRSSSGRGYSLDQPPPVNSMPPQRMVQGPSPTLPREMASDDLPYTSEETPRSKTRQVPRQLAEDTAPVPNSKAKTPPAPKHIRASKPPREEKRADEVPEMQSAPPEPTANEAQTESESKPTKRSWQMFSGNATKEKKTSTEPAEETKPTNSIVATTSAATLTGTKTTKEGRVKSPYAPFNELDVTGLPSGSLAMDPTTGKVFRVP